MPSQPDYEQAWKLSPHLKPPDKLAQRIQALEAKLREMGVDPETMAEAVAAAAPEEQTVQVNTDAKFFASKEGTKFYPISDAADSKVKPENRVYFASEEEATAAGFIR